MTQIVRSEKTEPKFASDIELPSQLLRVGSSGNANYRTIREALKAARPGDTILAEPGVYDEYLHVEKRVRIIGVGSATDVRIGHSMNTVLCSATHVHLENLSIKSELPDDVPVYDGEGYAVKVEKCALEMVKCIVTGGRHTISCEEGTEASIINCLIGQSSKDGIHADSVKRIKVVGCAVQNCKQHGIFLSCCEKQEISDTKISDCMEFGISTDSLQGVEPSTMRWEHNFRGNVEERTQQSDWRNTGEDLPF